MKEENDKQGWEVRVNNRRKMMEEIEQRYRIVQLLVLMSLLRGWMTCVLSGL
jgi:hypothetical protein